MVIIMASRAANTTTILYPQLEKVSDIFSLQHKEDDTPVDIMRNLIKLSLTMKLKECNGKLADFEGKYARKFSQFDNDWKQNKIANKYDYQIEADFIDWEALELLKNDILNLLIEL